MKLAPTPTAIAMLIGVVGLVGLLAYGLMASGPDRGIDAALQRGERVKAPAFELDELGHEVRRSLADYRGKVVVLNFWAPRRATCRAPDSRPL